MKQTKVYKNSGLWIIVTVLAIIVGFVFYMRNIPSKHFDSEQAIHPYTREDGSGTRKIFTEVTGLVDRAGDDRSSLTGTVQNSTHALTQTVSRDVHGIGYISLGSLDDSVKALSVDDVEPTLENIQAGTYKLARQLNVTYGKELTEVSQDFWNFLFSKEAQRRIEEKGYLPIHKDASSYEPTPLSGSITIVGSTSLEPLLQILTEEYQTYQPEVTIDISATGSSAGITMAIDGSADFGMSSREPTPEEAVKLIESRPIAIDGIVMIVNKENPVQNIDSEDIQRIYLNGYEYPNSWKNILRKLK